LFELKLYYHVRECKSVIAALFLIYRLLWSRENIVFRGGR